MAHISLYCSEHCVGSRTADGNEEPDSCQTIMDEVSAQLCELTPGSGGSSD